MIPEYMPEKNATKEEINKFLEELRKKSIIEAESDDFV